MLISPCKHIDLGRVKAKYLAFKQEAYIKFGSINFPVFQGLLAVSLFCIHLFYYTFAFTHSFPGSQCNYPTTNGSVLFLTQKLNPLLALNEFQQDHYDSPELLEILTSWISLFLALIPSVPSQRLFSVSFIFIRLTGKQHQHQPRL